MSPQPRSPASALIRLLDGSSRSPWLVWTPFAAYLTLLAAGISRHEPWFDEAQAWLLARDLPYLRLMFSQLRYEGTPGLWHSILFLATRAGIPYAGLNVIGGAAAAGAVFLLLRFSPFPALVRVMLPFTYFFAYQYAVVARNYNLLAPVLFATALLFPLRHRRPIAYVAILILLSHVSLHGAVVALGLALLEAPSLIGRAGRDARLWLAAVLFIANGILLAIQLYPPSDLVVAKQLGPHGIRPALENRIPPADRLWTVGIEMLHGGVADSPLLSELVLIAGSFWLLERRRLAAALVPITLLLVLSAFGYHSVWHDGTIWLVWIFALWLSYGTEPAVGFRRIWPGHWRQIATASLVVASAVQIVWTSTALSYDLSEPYSGSPAVAAKLRQLPCDGCRIHADGFKALAVEPFFSHNVFSNVNDGRADESFWRWSRANPLIRNGHESVWWNDPDYVVCGTGEGRKAPPQYTLIGFFPGDLFWKNRTFEEDSYFLLRRKAPGAVSATPVK